MEGTRRCSRIVRAQSSHAEGREFESQLSQTNYLIKLILVQRDTVAEWVERRFLMQKVESSNSK